MSYDKPRKKKKSPYTASASRLKKSFRLLLEAHPDIFKTYMPLGSDSRPVDPNSIRFSAGALEAFMDHIDQYLGRLGASLGRIHEGVLELNSRYVALGPKDKAKTFNAVSLASFLGLAGVSELDPLVLKEVSAGYVGRVRDEVIKKYS